MKTMMKYKSAVVTLLCAAALAGLAACEADPVETARGKGPDTETLENTYVKVRSVKTLNQFAVINITEGSHIAFDRIYCRLNRPAEKAMTVTATPDETLVEACNQKYGTELLPFPVKNVEIEGSGRISILQGERATDHLKVSFKSDDLLPGTYLLPVTISSDDATFTEDNRVVYYAIKVRGIDPGEYELIKDYTTVFYLNTMDYQPLLADIWGLQATEMMPPFKMLWEGYLGHIVNLRVVQLGCDLASGRPVLVLNSDMRYVLEHADKYIRPLQDKGRKVCLCLEGGSTGLGFCNLTDEQIADFTAQVKACIEQYGLDGVHFFDRNAGYGQEGMPATNTTSYPKLIRAMRQALGTEKLVTLADYEAPTAYFWDTEATGGIAVGEYLDYAWSGYRSESEDIQLVDPWLDPEMAGMFGIFTRERNKIAGLTHDRFGCVAMPWYSVSSPFMNGEIPGFINLGMWSMTPERNHISVYSDLTSNRQDKEMTWSMVPDLFWGMFGEGAMEGTCMYNTFPITGSFGMEYNYLQKDW